MVVNAVRRCMLRDALLARMYFRRMSTTIKASDVVEKLASAMMQERQQLMENAQASVVASQRIKDLEAVHLSLIHI